MEEKDGHERKEKHWVPLEEDEKKKKEQEEEMTKKRKMTYNCYYYCAIKRVRERETADHLVSLLICLAFLWTSPQDYLGKKYSDRPSLD